MNEIVFVRDAISPEKVFDEGDSLECGVDIHSFYWSREFNKPNDYEPVAVAKNGKYCITRLHYRGIILWFDYLVKGGKPVVHFSTGFHTPRMCSAQQLHSEKIPIGLEDKIALYYFKTRYDQLRSQNLDSYGYAGYNEMAVEGEVPRESRFLWKDIEYYIIVGPSKRLEELPIPDAIVERLSVL